MFFASSLHFHPLAHSVFTLPCISKETPLVIEGNISGSEHVCYLNGKIFVSRQFSKVHVYERNKYFFGAPRRTKAHQGAPINNGTWGKIIYKALNIFTRDFHRNVSLCDSRRFLHQTICLKHHSEIHLTKKGKFKSASKFFS